MATDYLLDLSLEPADVWITLDTIRHDQDLGEWASQQVPNDPYFSDGSLWGLNGLYGSAAPGAWGQTVGSLSTVIGVVDTGVDMSHPDVYRNIWINQREIPQTLKSQLADVNADDLFTFHDLNHSSNAAWVSDFNGNSYIDAYDLLADARWANGVDNAGNGYVDDLFGWNFFDDNNRPFDDDGHGTHVAGTIGAITHNATGVAGINWDVQLMPLRFMNPDGGYTSDAVRALDYFTWFARNDAGQQYVATNNSWGSGSYSSSLLSAIGRGAQADVLFVAAAGNDGTNNDRTAFYPSNYSTLSSVGYDAVVAVAATTSAGGLASFSNFGAVSVDLGAPGAGILSTVPGAGYAYYSGTSMAAPHVAGAAALFASANPQASAADIREALLATTTAMSALNGKTVTGGRLNMAELLQWDGQVLEPDPEPEPEPEPIPPTKPLLTTPAGISYKDTAANDVFSQATGRLQASDVNAGDVLRFGIVGVTPNVNGIASKTGSYGQLSLNVNTGDFTFVPNNGAIQARKINTSETYSVYVTDGVPQTADDIKSLVVSVVGANDPTVFSGTWTGQLQEDSVMVASGQVWASDRDAGDGQFTAAQVQGTYGVFSIDAQGQWRYELDNGSDQVQALGLGQQVMDPFEVQVSGGARKNLELTVLGSNDAPVLQALAPLVWEDTPQADVFEEVWGQLQAQDVDGPALVYGVQGGQVQQGWAVLDSRWGRLELEVDTGAYRFIPDVQAIEAEKDEVSETLTVYVSDGLAVSEQALQVVVLGADDPGVVGGETTGAVTEDGVSEAAGQLFVQDRDLVDAAWQAVSLQGLYGSIELTAGGQWVYRLANASDAVNALAQGQMVTDSFVLVTAGGLEQWVEIAVEGSNDGPSGELVVRGAPMAGQWLSAHAEIRDPEGLGDFSFQWLLDGEVVPGATGERFKVRGVHVGAQVALQLTYVDGSGVAESVLTQVPQAVVPRDGNRLIVGQIESVNSDTLALYVTASGRYVIAEQGIEGPALLADPLWLKSGKQPFLNFQGGKRFAVFDDEGGVKLLSRFQGNWLERQFSADGVRQGKLATLPLWAVMEREYQYQWDFNGDGVVGDVVMRVVDADGYGTDPSQAGWGLYRSQISRGFYVDAISLGGVGAVLSPDAMLLRTGAMGAWKSAGLPVLGMAESPSGYIEVLMKSGGGYLAQSFDKASGLKVGKPVKFGRRAADLPERETWYGLDLNADGQVGLAAA